jgi:hypothetical protein
VAFEFVDRELLLNQLFMISYSAKSISKIILGAFVFSTLVKAGGASL